MHEFLVWFAQCNLICAFLNPFFAQKGRLWSGISFINLLFATLTLIFFYLADNFQVLNVWQNSSSIQPLLYKITGFYGNHEGSMLLFCFMISFWQIIAWRIKIDLPREKIALLISIVNSLFLFFILFYGNPFFTTAFTENNGLGLNPILQDTAIAIHPPMLYLGYTSSIILFSMTLIALWQQKIDQKLFEKLKFFNMITWIFLLIGIALGSWWAYTELGWGGVWFWDPVENISLLPFLTSLSLLHTLKSVRGNPKFQNINTLFSILTFCFCVNGFFLTRSGVLQSIHTFAVDKERAIALFLITLAIIIPAIGYFFYKQKSILIAQKKYNTTGKIIFLEFIINAVFITIIYFSIIYPLIFQFFKQQEISINADFFSKTLFFPLLLALIFMGTIDFRKKKFFSYKIIATSIFTLIIFFIFSSPLAKLNFLSFAILECSIFLSIICIIDLFFYFFCKRKRNLNMLFAHLGFGILLCGLIISNGLEQVYEHHMSVGDQFMNMTVKNFLKERNKNYFAITAQILLQNAKKFYTFYPQIKFFPIEGIQVAEPFIHRAFFYDLHVIMTDFSSENNSANFFVEYKPLMNLIWLGFFCMCGGGISFFIKVFKKY